MTRAWSETRVEIDPDENPAADTWEQRDATWWWRGFYFGSIVGLMVGMLTVAVLLWAADAVRLERRPPDPAPVQPESRG